MKRLITMAGVVYAACLLADAEPVIVYNETVGGVSPVQQLVNAVTGAVDGATILIKPGTYTFDDDDYSDIVNGVTNLLRVKVSDVTIEGDTDTSRTNWTDHAEPVIINANGKGRIFYFDNNRTNMTVRNLTLTGANTLSGANDTAKSGGAAFCNDSSYTERAVFTNCVFRDNVDGRACAGYHVTLRDCLVTNCSANVGTCYYAFIGKAYDSDFVGNRMGACYYTYAYNCRFIDNFRSGGGAAFANPYIISNCLFEANSGYALSDSSTSSQFLDCTFRSNTTSNSGLLMNPGTVKRCLFEGNAVYGGGGGIIINKAGSYLAENCTFRWNLLRYSNAHGGGIFMARKTGVLCSMVVTNCTFEGNVGGTGIDLNHPYSGSGGAICNNPEHLPAGEKAWDYLTAYDCTFITNHAVRGAGVVGVHAVRCKFYDNRKTSPATGGMYGGDAWESFLEDCEITGGEIANSVLNRCEIHNVTNATYGIFKDYVRATNCIVRNCWNDADLDRAMYVAPKVLDAEFVNCTFVTNVMNTYAITANGSVTNPVKFVNCIFNGNRKTNRDSDFVATSRAGYALWSEFVFENTYYGKFVGDTYLSNAAFTSKLGEGALMQCDDPKFAKDNCPDAPWSLSFRSPLLGKGSVADWMDGATDLAGRPRLRDGKVDVGCYQCWLNPPGMMMIVR